MKCLIPERGSRVVKLLSETSMSTRYLYFWMPYEEMTDVNDSAVVTYIDSEKRLVLDVQFEIGVASVIESLTQATQSISEHLNISLWLV